MVEIIENSLFIAAFVSIATSVAIPLIRWLGTQTKNEHLKHVESIALQIVQDVNAVASTLSGPERKAEAAKQLKAVFAGKKIAKGDTDQDYLRVIQASYENLKASGLLNEREKPQKNLNLPANSDEPEPIYTSK